MYATVIFRARAQTSAEAVRLIERASAQIRRPNSGHSFGYVIAAVFSYRSGGPVAAQVDGAYGQRMWDGWRADDALQSEEALCRLILRRREGALVGPASWALDGSEQDRLREVFADYEARAVDREAERGLLREAEAPLRPLVEQTARARRDAAVAIGPYAGYVAPEVAWAKAPASWRWIKRHTTQASFPFIRLGVDVYKAFAYEVGAPADPAWYALVRYHY